jgi:hypothetical protein
LKKTSKVSTVSIVPNANFSQVREIMIKISKMSRMFSRKRLDKEILPMILEDRFRKKETLFPGCSLV